MTTKNNSFFYILTPIIAKESTIENYTIRKCNGEDLKDFQHKSQRKLKIKLTVIFQKILSPFGKITLLQRKPHTPPSWPCTPPPPPAPPCSASPLPRTAPPLSLHLLRHPPAISLQILRGKGAHGVATGVADGKVSPLGASLCEVSE